MHKENTAGYTSISYAKNPRVHPLTEIEGVKKNMFNSSNAKEYRSFYAGGMKMMETTRRVSMHESRIVRITRSPHLSVLRIFKLQVSMPIFWYNDS